MCLNHPETIPTSPHPTQPLVHRKLVFHKSGPWCQKDWRLLV